MVVGIITALILLPIRDPNILSSASDPEIIPVVRSQANDARSVVLKITGGDERQIKSNVSGVITALNINSGSTIKSGEAPIEINGQKISFIHTPVPSYQNAEHLIWINSAEVKISSLNVSLGDNVQVGQILLSIPNAIKSAQILNYPQNLIDGDRVLNLGDTEFSVDDKGNIADNDLPRILTSSAFLSRNSNESSSSGSGQASQGVESKNDGSIQIPAKLMLKNNVDVTVIPPRSIITNSDGSSCVISEGKFFAISIIDSELGRSFVHFEENDPPQNIKYKPAESEKCP